MNTTQIATLDVSEIEQVAGGNQCVQDVGGAVGAAGAVAAVALAPFTGGISLAAAALAGFAFGVFAASATESCK